MSLPRQEKAIPMAEHNKTLHMLGSAGAAALEVVTFHPVDTIQKRLMNSSHPIFNVSKPWAANLHGVYNIAFRSPKTNAFSLYPGLSFAVGYKITQRVYKFGGQPIVENMLRNNFFDESNKFWPKALSGAMMGAGEVFLLPIDIYKIRMQTGSIDKGVSFRGGGITIARNSFGSFALFGVPELVSSMTIHDTKPTKSQVIGTQFAGVATCLLVSSPFDVVKTRMQADVNAGNARAIGLNIATNNPSHFFRAIGPGLLAQGIRLTFFMATKDFIMEKMEESKRLTP